MLSIQAQAIFVLITIFILFALIYTEKVKPAVGFLLVVLTFTITGILDADEVLSGFSNQSIASILMLILISAGVRKNFRIEVLFDIMFKKAKTYRGFLFNMMSMVAAFSSFISNTPVVALMTPYVVDWGEKKGIAPSRLLIPLSYATILGGMITLIGTSTTLVLNGFLQENNLAGIEATDLLIIGLSVTITGIAFIGFVGYKLLPDHKDLLKDYNENIREYVTETRLLKGSSLVEKTVHQAGLRNLKGVYLVEIFREGRIISPVGPNETLLEGDSLFFAGNTADIVELVNSEKGLALPTTARSLQNDKTEVLEAVISNFSSIVGKTVKESDFRNRYNAAIIAVNRNGERVMGKIGDIRLESGDLLLLYAGDDFRTRTEIFRDLFIVSKLKEIVKPGKKTVYALVSIVLAALILLIYGKFSLFPSLMIILSVMIGFQLISSQDVKRELDLNLIAILVFSLAIGKAIYKTDAGLYIADQIIHLFHPAGTIGLLFGLYVITNLLTSFVTNVGAVSIAFPIAFSLSQSLGIDGTPFYLAIAYAASSAFLTPISYQTNLIVYGPGGYNFKDFFRIGLPVTIVYMIIALTVISLLYKEVLF